MSKAKTPQEKKHLSYERDHINIPFTTNKGTRKSWPRKEARIAREFRRKVGQTLRKGTTDAVEDMESANRSIPREQAKKSGATALREAVAKRLQARVERKGRHKALHAYYDASGITYPSKLSKPRKRK